MKTEKTREKKINFVFVTICALIFLVMYLHVVIM